MQERHPPPHASSHTGEAFRTGLEVLLAEHRDWIAGRRIGLITHRAAVDTRGRPSAECFRAESDANLVALFGPEHGFGGSAAAGESTANQTHPDWGIPIFSLYGATRRMTPAMLAGVDTLVYDLQDLGARPYTYVSTLRYVLEDAARAGKSVIVADRPIPLPSVVDGPTLQPGFESFVAAIPTPMLYGMTPGELALWLRRELTLDLDLHVAPMSGYRREPQRQPDWPPWVRPSPRIASWECGACFTMTVGCEALPAVDYGSGTDWCFQVFRPSFADPHQLADVVSREALPGIAWDVVVRPPAPGMAPEAALAIRITDAAIVEPVRTGVALLDAAQQIAGPARLWDPPGTRPAFFDQLFGTDRVRDALQHRVPARQIADGWHSDLAAFRRTRASALLYHDKP